MSNQLVILVKLPLKGHNHLVLIVGIVLVFFFFSFKNVFTFFQHYLAGLIFSLVLF